MMMAVKLNDKERKKFFGNFFKNFAVNYLNMCMVCVSSPKFNNYCISFEFVDSRLHVLTGTGGGGF